MKGKFFSRNGEVCISEFDIPDGMRPPPLVVIWEDRTYLRRGASLDYDLVVGWNVSNIPQPELDRLPAMD